MVATQGPFSEFYRSRKMGEYGWIWLNMAENIEILYIWLAILIQYMDFTAKILALTTEKWTLTYQKECVPPTNSSLGCVLEWVSYSTTI